MFGSKTFKKLSHREDVNSLYANFKSSLGEFKIELFHKECPETVWNFINLSEGKQETIKEGPYYNGLVFHRVIEGFMIQGGCPLGNGTGGPGYKFEDETSANLKHDVEGVLSMANAGPGTNGSQFFITLVPTPHLDGRHTVFGKVISGMDVVKLIGGTQTGMMDRPTEDIVIEEVIIIRD